MSGKSDESRINAAIDALGRSRGPCPDVDEVLAFAMGSLDELQRSAIEAHVALCPGCAILVERAAESAPEPDELTWKRSEKRLDRRPKPWQAKRSRRAPIAAALAAALALAVGIAWWRLPAPPVDPGVRGADFAAVSPSGSLTRVSGFAWMAQPLAERYRVSLVAGEALVWEETTTGQSVAAPLDLLHPGQRFRWRVEALDKEDGVIGQTAWTEFRITPIGDADG